MGTNKMTIKYGPNITNLNLIYEKAKTKKNGVYSFRGVMYLVINNRFTHFAYNQELTKRCGCFNANVGWYLSNDQGKRQLLFILKEHDL